MTVGDGVREFPLFSGREWGEGNVAREGFEYSGWASCYTGVCPSFPLTGAWMGLGRVSPARWGARGG